MDNHLKLKIDRYWCALKEDTGISIEMTSPLWNESGAFSYTFAVPYFANRHIFNAAELPESDVNLKTFRKRFGLYVDGIGLLFGDVLCSSDEIDTDEDSVDLELRSGNATFEDAVDGKNLRDLDMERLIGFKVDHSRTYQPTYAYTFVKSPGTSGITGGDYIKIPTGTPYSSEEIQEIYNLSGIYPQKDFVNIPIIVNGKKDGGDEMKPVVLSPMRSCSSPCFFVLFLLDKCFQMAGMHIVRNSLADIEDMRRMIVLNTRFEYDRKNIKRYPAVHDREMVVSDVSGPYTFKFKEFDVTENSDLYASSKNLPDISVSDFVDSLKNAFGMRMLVDDSMGVRIVLVRDILRSTETVNLVTGRIRSVTKRHVSFPGALVKYNTDEGDEYSYNDYSVEKAYDDYDSLITEWQGLVGKKDEYGNVILESDRTLKIVRDTGNFYRTKVDKEKYEVPQLFEVAQNLPYEVPAEGEDADDPEEMAISFNPVIPTQVQTSGDGRFVTLAQIEAPDEAFFVDAEFPWKGNQVNNKDKTLNIDHLPDELVGGNEIKFNYNTVHETLKEILEYDCGFTVGILRTAPEDSPSGEYYEIVSKDWDGFGNDEWAVTVSTNTVTSDSITKQGAVYDYNGSGEGIGTSINQLISLKLWSGKQNFDPSNLVSYDESGHQITGADVYDNNPTGPLPNRGLVPQFLSEYLHFLKHRKTLEIVAEMEVAEIVNIKWDKYYRVAGYRCLLNKVSFEAGNGGIGLVTLEVYCI